MFGSKLSLSSYAEIRGNDSQGKISLSLFDLDATPPVVNELAYDLMTNSWDLGLRAKGVVLHGTGKPIVLCAIDWMGISNEGYDEFRSTIARAAGTIPERVAVHTVHPQSYYRTGVANPDFPGVARFLRQLAVPEALHIHFNGASGDIGAGKYNDGSKENRLALATRMAEGMKKAWENTKKERIASVQVSWKQVSLAFTPAPYLARLKKELKNTPSLYGENVDYARKMAWYERCLAGKKVNISCLSIGRARILHLPSEMFVEYQLAAKNRRPDLFLAVAAYGEYGPGYIGTDGI